jgi:hypothetical protein
MMCKFLAQPHADHTAALAYCMGTIDSKGVPHDEVMLLHGSPDDFDRVVSTLTFAERYKSFVASWSPGDAPDEQQLESFIVDFQRLCFGDLDPDRFCWVGFLHRKDDKVDFHALIANVELTTGNSFNAAPPKWQFGFDALRDMHNARAGWASPADPRLARKVQLGNQPRWRAARAKKGLSVATDTKSMLAMEAFELVESGQISSREALIAHLASQGFIKRVRKDSITVVPVGMEEGIRLKGAIFAEGFDFGSQVRPGPRPSRTSKDHAADRDPVAEEEARLRFEAAVKKRQVRNEERYAPKKARTKQASGAQANPASTVAFAPSNPMDLAPPMASASPPAVLLLPPAIPGLLAPPLIQSIPKTKDQHHEELRRSAFSRVTAELVSDLRDRFEQLARRVVEFGRNIRTKRWLHAPRFDLPGNAGVAAGKPDAIDSTDERVNQEVPVRMRP